MEMFNVKEEHKLKRKPDRQRCSHNGMETNSIPKNILTLWKPRFVSVCKFLGSDRLEVAVTVVTD